MGVLISAERVLLGPAGEALDDGAVLVAGSRIAAVGPRAEVEAAAGPGVERMRTTTLLPGLVDAHVHLVFSPGVGLEASVVGQDDDALVAAATRHACELLDGGVTTARDLGDTRDVARRMRDATARGDVVGPRLLVAGSPLTLPGGHCWFLGGEVEPGDETALRRAVADRAAAGADVVKVMASGGQSTPGGASMWERQFDAAALGVIVDEARRHGLPVAAHAHGADSIADAATAGVTTVEHCTWMSGSGASDQRADVADTMAATGVVACSGSSGDWTRIAERVGRERAREIYGRMRWMADRGVTVILGTDAGLTPFDDFAATLGRWREWGFGSGELLEMATARAADVLGLGDVTGRLRPGLDADLLLVGGHPEDDLADLAAIEAVLARGRVHRPDRRDSHQNRESREGGTS